MRASAPSRWFGGSQRRDRQEHNVRRRGSCVEEGAERGRERPTRDAKEEGARSGEWQMRRWPEATLIVTRQGMSTGSSRAIGQKSDRGFHRRVSFNLRDGGHAWHEQGHRDVREATGDTQDEAGESSGHRGHGVRTCEKSLKAGTGRGVHQGGG
jgi:hypothetical protein